MSFRGVALLLIVAAAAFPLAGQDRMVIEHSPLSCVPSSCGHARIAARVIAPSPAHMVRVYFRATDQPAEYYLDMLKGTGDTYWAVLPVAADGTEAIAYRVVARDTAGREVSTETITAPVTAGCPSPGLTGEEKAFAANLAIGLTSDAQAAVPSGFRCSGVQNVIGTNDVMRPNEECRQILVANPAEGCNGPVAARAGRELTTAQGAGLVAAGAVIGVATAIIHEDKVVNDKKPVSTLRP